jgi:hypothetical protein
LRNEFPLFPLAKGGIGKSSGKRRANLFKFPYEGVGGLFFLIKWRRAFYFSFFLIRRE